MSEDSNLTEPIPTLAPKLPGYKLDGETLIGWYEEKYISYDYSGGVYSDYVLPMVFIL